MRTQVTTFSIMIFLTLISFTAVVADFSKYYIIPIILLLAAVQVVLQLYYFMHMSEKIITFLLISSILQQWLVLHSYLLS